MPSDPPLRHPTILGFCDIHHFEYCTQQLGNDVLTFTNAIAEIVHSNVHFWRGACNKNLGNAFVLLWRIGDEEELLATYGGGGRHMVKRASLSQSMAQLGEGENEGHSNNNNVITLFIDTCCYRRSLHTRPFLNTSSLTLSLSLTPPPPARPPPPQSLGQAILGRQHHHHKQPARTVEQCQLQHRGWREFRI